MTRVRDPQTTLVTGGAGFVGRHLVASLARAGHRVIVVDSAFDPDVDQFWSGRRPVRLVADDVRNLASSVSEPVDSIIHAAAVTGTPVETGAEPEVQFLEAIEAVGTVLRWARQRNVARTILMSSGAVLGDSRDRLWNEDSPPAPASIYASAKLATEIFGAAMHRHHGLDVVTVRLGNVYGPGELARVTRPKTSLVNRMLQEGIDSGSIRAASQGSVADWTYAADIGDAMVALLAAQRLEHRLYHLTSEEMLRTREVAHCIAVALTEAGRDTVVIEEEIGGRERPGALVGTRAHLEFGLGSWTPFRRGIRETVAHALRSVTKEQET